MSDDPDIWVKLGIRIQDLLAGFAGGTVNAFVLKRVNPWSILSSMVVGGLMANYLSETMAQYLGGTKVGVSGFVIGMAGNALAQGIIEASRSWRPFGLPNGKEKERGGNNAGSSS